MKIRGDEDFFVYVFYLQLLFNDKLCKMRHP